MKAKHTHIHTHELDLETENAQTRRIAKQKTHTHTRKGPRIVWELRPGSNEGKAEENGRTERANLTELFSDVSHSLVSLVSLALVLSNFIRAFCLWHRDRSDGRMGE